MRFGLWYKTKTIKECDMFERCQYKKICKKFVIDNMLDWKTAIPDCGYHKFLHKIYNS